MKIVKGLGILAALVLLNSAAWADQPGDIDASDPTKVYSFAGLGYKFTDFSNGDSLSEIRAIGNMGVTENDMVLFEVGYGRYSGSVLNGEKKDGITNARARYFHLFNMDYSVARGYRGLATQVDLQLEGTVKGTTGGNTLAIGAMPAFGWSASWSFFLPVNYVSTWGTDFKNHQGHGISIAPLAVFAPEEGPWPGFFLQIWPSYTRYFAGDLDGEGGANLDLTTGWSITPTIVATATFQQNFDKNLKIFHPSSGTSGASDWNLFASVNLYF